MLRLKTSLSVYGIKKDRDHLEANDLSNLILSYYHKDCNCLNWTTKVEWQCHNRIGHFLDIQPVIDHVIDFQRITFEMSMVLLRKTRKAHIIHKAGNLEPG